MINRLLITWLVLSILGSGMALAIDIHDELLAEQVHLSSADHSSPDHPESDAVHDHCGHASFHLLGLNSIPTDLKVLGSHSPEERYLVVWNSHLSPPPSQPPKA